MTAERLRELMDAPGATLLAGCHDGVSARLVQRADFAAAHLSGFAVSASLIGEPDIGLLTLSEMADAVARLARLLDIPLLADGDTGYGNEFNVARTIESYARAGASGIHLEDQVMPKRCGHLTGKEIVPVQDMVSKLDAAVAERDRGNDLVIIARTDAASIEGLDAAIERARRYRDTGVDGLFVEGMSCAEDAAAVASALHDVALVCNMSEARPPCCTLDTMGDLGFTLAFAPITSLLSGARGMVEGLARLRAEGPTRSHLDQMMSYDELLDLVGFTPLPPP